MLTSTTTKTKKTQKKIQNFTERTEERLAKENQWQQYNASTDFSEQIEESLEILAGKTFPTDIGNRHAYQEAIVNSLTETISPEIGIKDFWRKMGETGCVKISIEDGHLTFYTRAGKRIDITPYTQPIVFEAHSSYYDQRVIERKAKIEEAQKQLHELLAEINRTRRA